MDRETFVGRLDRQPEDPLIAHLIGSARRDSAEEKIRIYPDPGNLNAYYSVKIDDIVGDIHELHRDELVHSGYIGSEVFKVPLRVGTMVEYTATSIERVGETIEPHSVSPLVSSRVGAGCRTSSCKSTPCCSESEVGRCRCNYCCIV